MIAVVRGAIRIVATLLENGADVNAKGDYGLTALHEAASHEQVEIAHCLLKFGALIDATSEQGVTPLMCAAANGDFELTRLLLKLGADISKVDCRGGTAGDAAHEKGEDAVGALIDTYVKLDKS